MAIATVIAISGQAWARDEAGNLRELRIGDVLQEGETLITSSDGRIELDFADGSGSNVVEGGQQVAVSPELNSEQIVATEDASALDDDVEALLAALEEGEGDLLELLDAAAAGGAGGGGGDGHGFVRVARIAEETDPLSFQTSGGLEQAEFVEFDGASAALVAEDESIVEPSPDGSLTVVAEPPSTGTSTLAVSGAVSSVPIGNTITVTITDQSGNSVETVAIVDPDGSYSVGDIDVSGLIDGPLTIVATTTDNNGNTIDATDTVELDAVASSITVAATVDNDTATLDISGTTQDVPAGSTVVLTITDQNGTTVDTTATVNPDGSYSVDAVDVNSLTDGELTVVATATDNNGNTIDATDTVELDALDGSLSVTLGALDDVTSVEISGTTVDVAAGETVTLVIS
uniref:retention module-containing protein n=1 Tax=Vreelandella olivaria TaxID=390919 RepID=UPI00201F9B42